MQKHKYTALQMPVYLANVMADGTVTGGLTATGSTSQANSFPVTDDISLFTTVAAATGARLAADAIQGDVFIIANYGANTLLTYPPSGGNINNGSTNASISIPAGEGYRFTCTGPLTYLITGQFLAPSRFARIIQVAVTDPNGSAITTGEEIQYARINSILNGWNLTAVAAHVSTVSSSGLPTMQIRNVTTGFDMLTTALTIDASEKDSLTAATPAVIDASHQSVSTGDEIAIDIDGAGTGAKGLVVELTFQAP